MESSDQGSLSAPDCCVSPWLQVNMIDNFSSDNYRQFCPLSSDPYWACMLELQAIFSGSFCDFNSYILLSLSTGYQPLTFFIWLRDQFGGIATFFSLLLSRYYKKKKGKAKKRKKWGGYQNVARAPTRSNIKFGMPCILWRLSADSSHVWWLLFVLLLASCTYPSISKYLEWFWILVIPFQILNNFHIFTFISLLI